MEAAIAGRGGPVVSATRREEAARELRLSPNTLHVHVHVRSLYRHYNVNTRAELMAKLLAAR
jgi:DNA-binding NarL/FixJ family response regulator